MSSETSSLLYKFILDKDGEATKSDAISYMENNVEEKFRISRDTTMKEIEKMKSQGIIDISKPERKGLPHYLSINDENEFNQISRALVALGRLIDIIEEPLESTDNTIANHISIHSGETEENCHDCKMLVNLRIDFFDKFMSLINIGLDLLLYRINDNITNKNNQWDLYSGIIKEKIRLYTDDIQLMNLNIYPPLEIKLGEEEEKCAKKHGIPIDILMTHLQEINTTFNEQMKRAYKNMTEKLI